MAWNNTFSEPSGGTGTVGPEYLTETEGDARYLPITYIPVWDSITGKPLLFPPINHGHLLADLPSEVLTEGEANLLYKAIGYVPNWSDISGKPAVFPPAAHAHLASDLPIATDAEATAKTATDKLITPAHLAAISSGATILTKDSRLVTDAASTFPTGHSIMEVTQGNWPGGVTHIVTVRTVGQDVQRSEGSSDTPDQARSWSGTAWTPWVRVGGSDFAAVSHSHIEARATSHELGGRSGFMSAAQAETLRVVELSPFVNMQNDSGRFGHAGSVPLNPLARDVTTFANTGFFALQNSSTMSNAGEFIHNNTTNGGTAGALTQAVIDLLAAMGRTGAAARFGVEFFVAAITQGTGTLSSGVGSDGVTRYLTSVNGDRVLFGFNSMGTFSAWIRCVSGSFHMKNNGSEPNAIWVNGSKLAEGQDHIMAAGGGWKHVRLHFQGALGYNSTYPFIHGGHGAVLQIALTSFSSGPSTPEYTPHRCRPSTRP